jgi:hypothetical protein
MDYLGISSKSMLQDRRHDCFVVDIEFIKVFDKYPGIAQGNAQAVVPLGVETAV